MISDQNLSHENYINTHNVYDNDIISLNEKNSNVNYNKRKKRIFKNKLDINNKINNKYLQSELQLSFNHFLDPEATIYFRNVQDYNSEGLNNNNFYDDEMKTYYNN